jgi:AraC-like DNA-binding protein
MCPASHGDSRDEVVTSDDVEHWSNAICDAYGSLHIVPERGDRFTASLSRKNFDRLMAVEMAATPQAFHRTAPMVTRSPTDDFIVTLVLRGQGVLVQDGRMCTIGPGEFVFMTSSRPYSCTYESEFQVYDFAWPREAIGLSVGESEALTARTFASHSPMAQWLRPTLLNLLDLDQHISPAGATRVANGLAGLVAAAALELSEPDAADDRSRRQYDDMLSYIEHHIDDPHLSSESLGEAFFVSDRTVNRLFARFGQPAANVIRDRRLEACRLMMLSPAHRSKSISYIASQFGYSSIQGFSRAFSSKYGLSPRDYRLQRI